MNEKCYVDGCPGTAKFTCSCDKKIQICQEHIAEHIRDFSYHEISSSNLTQNLTQFRTNQAIYNLSHLNSRALSEGKDMFKDLCAKLCDIVDEMSKRQQCLVDLSVCNYSKDVEEKIKDLETVNIAFRDKKDFKKLLDNFMSSEDTAFDSSSLNEFRRDFKGIVDSLKISNDFLHKVSEANKEDYLLRQHLEYRMQQLEQGCGKVDNLEERLKKLESSSELNLKSTRDLIRSTEVSRKKAENVEKLFKEKCKEIARNGRQQFQEFQALQEGNRRGLEEVTRSLNQQVRTLEENFKGIKEVSQNEFRLKIVDLFTACNNRYNTLMEQERQRKAMEEEKERKRIRDEQGAKLIKEKDLIKNLSLQDKVKYYQKVITSAWSSWDLNDCLRCIEHIQSTNDGKYLFVCTQYSDCINKLGIS